MAGHIPDGGSCLVVYASNVGVDSKGNVGTVESSGRTNGIPCCGSSIAAAAAVAAIAKKGGTKTSTAPATTTVPLLDAHQHSVVDMLLPYADRLETANDKMVELPYCVYDAQKKMMASVVTAGRRAIVGTANIAVLGGIQINTPEDQSDYYLPLSFEVFNKKGRKLEDLTVLL
jgi:Limiting CO2-inducible proteins B/C beta carbonyic anhydrases